MKLIDMLPPQVEPGLVIRYSFLWRHEADKGTLEGAKDRPVLVVVLVSNGQEGLVAPITTKASKDKATDIEMPASVAKHLGLGIAPCWITIDTLNQFVWPGPDLRVIPGSTPKKVAYGFVPQKLLDRVKAKVIQKLVTRVPGFIIKRSSD
jgi:hypothetical protein